MKVFLSALERPAKTIMKGLADEGKKLDFGLASYYYIRKHLNTWHYIYDNTNEILIDSGAHTLQKGKNVDWEAYTHEYAQWIIENDSDKILGYFEMDVDNRIGYDRVLSLRKILDSASDKIIPVWHKNRGVDEFKRMCKETKGDIVAITGFRNEDIKDEQYGLFLKYAWSQGKKVHCLGMTRIKVLDKVPFDYVDSSSWIQTAVWGSVKDFKNGKFVHTDVSGLYETKDLEKFNFDAYVKMQQYYYKKWRHVNND